MLVGTTDEEVAVDAELVVTKQDVDFMLGQLNKYASRRITSGEIVSGFAGMRPLVGSGEGGSTAKLARDDVIEVDAASGLISIMGGKWTTHRAMGEDTITRVQTSLNVPITASPTPNHVLYGGEGYTADYWKKLCQDYQVSEATAHHLASKFGTASEKVLALKGENPALLQPILAGHPPIQAEVVYSVRYEMAATIEDVLARRMGMQLYSWSNSIDAAPIVGSLLAAELGWNSGAARDAVAQYVAKINHLLQSAGLSYQSSNPGQ